MKLNVPELADVADELRELRAEPVRVVGVVRHVHQADDSLFFALIAVAIGLFAVAGALYRAAAERD